MKGGSLHGAVPSRTPREERSGDRSSENDRLVWPSTARGNLGTASREQFLISILHRVTLLTVVGKTATGTTRLILRKLTLTVLRDLMRLEIIYFR